MKRTDLIRKLEKADCVLVRNGGNHDGYQNPQPVLLNQYPDTERSMSSSQGTSSKSSVLELVSNRDNSIKTNIRSTVCFMVKRQTAWYAAKPQKRTHRKVGINLSVETCELSTLERELAVSR